MSGLQVSKFWSPPLCSVWSYTVLCDWSAKIVYYAVLCQGFRLALGRPVFVSHNVCKVKMLLLHRSPNSCASGIIPFRWTNLNRKKYEMLQMKLFTYGFKNMFIFQKFVSCWVFKMTWEVGSPGTRVAVKSQQVLVTRYLFTFCSGTPSRTGSWTMNPI